MIKCYFCIVKQFIPSINLCYDFYFSNAQFAFNIFIIMAISLRSGPKYWDISYVMNGLDVFFCCCLMLHSSSHTIFSTRMQNYKVSLKI